MINQIRGYWAWLFYLATLSTSYVLTVSCSNVLIYGVSLLGICIIFTSIGTIYRGRVLSCTPFVLGYFVAIFLYQFTFGLINETERSWSYFISKSVVCLSLGVSIPSNLSFYKEKFLDYTSVLAAVFIFLGVLFFRVDFAGRYALGFGNPNGLGAVAAIACGSLIIFSNLPKNLRLICIIMCSVGVLMSGSRSAIGILVMSLLIKYGLKPRLLLTATFLLIAVLLISQILNVQSVGIERFYQTVSTMDLSSNRAEEREATMLMIQSSPLTGNGLYAQQSEAAKVISELGSHCGYLDILKMMGIPFGGGLIIYILFQTLTLFLHFVKSPYLYEKAHLFIIVSIIFAAFFEAYIWGVFQVTTTMLFISFSTLQSIYYNHDKNAK